MTTKRRPKAKKKARQGKKRGGAKLKMARRRGRAANRLRVIVSPSDSSISPYAMDALRIFRHGVSEALEDFGNRNIEVVVSSANGMIRGVPKRRDGAIVVEPQRLRRS